MKFYFIVQSKKMPDLEDQVKELMLAFPKLDRMICETLLKTSPESLQTYLGQPETKGKQPEELVLKSVEIS